MTSVRSFSSSSRSSPERIPTARGAPSDLRSRRSKQIQKRGRRLRRRSGSAGICSTQTTQANGAASTSIFAARSRRRFSTIREKPLRRARSPRSALRALQSGAVDLLSRGAPWTQARDTGQQRFFTPPSHFTTDRAFLVAQEAQISVGAGPLGRTICVQQGTSLRTRSRRLFSRARSELSSQSLFPSFEEAAKAYDDEHCEALSGRHYDALALSGRSSRGPAITWCCRTSSRRPRAGRGAPGRRSVVQHRPLDAFRHARRRGVGVTSANADVALKSENPQIRRLLGVDGDHGDGLGLSPIGPIASSNMSAITATCSSAISGRARPRHGAPAERAVVEGRPDVCAAGAVSAEA